MVGVACTGRRKIKQVGHETKSWGRARQVSRATRTMYSARRKVSVVYCTLSCIMLIGQWHRGSGGRTEQEEEERDSARAGWERRRRDEREAQDRGQLEAEQQGAGGPKGCHAQYTQRQAGQGQREKRVPRTLLCTVRVRGRADRGAKRHKVHKEQATREGSKGACRAACSVTCAQ